MNRSAFQVKSPLLLPWVRPSDWPVIDNVADNEINILVKTCAAFALSVVTDDSDEYSIKWGDNSVSTGLTSGEIQEHVFTTGGTPCSEGYDTWKIVIYDASSAIVSFKFERHSLSTRQQQFPVIDIAFGTNYLTELVMADNASPGRSISYLRSCTLPQFLNPISLKDLLSNAHRLQYVKFPDSLGGANDARSMLHNCKSLRSFKMWSDWGNVVLASACFQYCGFTELTLPASWGNVTSAQQMFYNMPALMKVNLPSSWGSITNIQSMFGGCTILRSVNLPSSWGASLTNASYLFSTCMLLNDVAIPSTWGSLTDITGMFQQSGIVKIILPTSWGSLQKISNLFSNCWFLIEVTLATSLGSALTEAIYMFSYTYEVLKINNLQFVGNATTACDLTGVIENICTYSENIVINSKLKSLGLNGASGNMLNVTSIRLNPSADSTFLGSSPQVNVQYTKLNAAALDLLFGDLPTVSGKTINITGCTGAAGCTRSIAQGKGWTVTG